MKILATIKGTVVQFNAPPEPSIVSLVNSEKNESCQTKGDSARLQAQGIDYPGCEFEITVIRDDRGRETSTMKRIYTKTPDTASVDFAI